MNNTIDNISRRNFLKTMGALAGLTAIASCKGGSDNTESPTNDDYQNQAEPPVGCMTMRHGTKDDVSLLGYGMMRLPTISNTTAGETQEIIDQERVNQLVDYAMQHGVNYYDTSPVYCRGLSEAATGEALARHSRDKFFVATKLSNFSESTWSREASIEMYHNSFRNLRVDVIDYYLLHSVGNGDWDTFAKRYIDNGIIDFLDAERAEGRIRNLGFSFHGDIRTFDWLMSQHDRYHWDFCQIQLNYIDWDFADETNDRNTDARYLYDECAKRNIPVVVMEPLLGGRLASLPQYIVNRLKEREPQRSVASWAFRYAGTHPQVLTVLSGMTYMEHLKDNLLSYCPLKPLTDDEMAFLYDVAADVYNLRNIPCTGCQYCMPCPYGVNIPAIFQHYNKCKNEGTLPSNQQSDDYARLRRQYLISLDRNVERLRQADHCIGCCACISHCPQNISIPRELHNISEFVEQLKRENI